jgi:hypothetical protein
MDAESYAEQLKARCFLVLQEIGHLPCQWSDRARYEPDSGAVVCGCGEFAEMPDGLQEAVHGQAVGTPITSKGGTLTYEARDPIDSTLALIDPSEVYSPVDVERHILDVLARLETGALFERETVRGEYDAKTAFERAYWRALNASTEGSADRRKADAMVQCEQLHEALIQAEFLAKAAKATMHNLRAVLSGYQSTARSVGAAYQAGGSQGGVPR